MSETLTGTTTDANATVPEYPMTRAQGCPFAPPPKLVELGAAKPLNRVRIWDGTDVVLGLTSQRRRPAPGISALA
jgi:hypothetical protein